MEASMRETSQTPKRYDHSGDKNICWNILDSLKLSITFFLDYSQHKLEFSNPRYVNQYSEN
jgi:hypothetical protein